MPVNKKSEKEQSSTVKDSKDTKDTKSKVETKEVKPKDEPAPKQSAKTAAPAKVEETKKTLPKKEEKKVLVKDVDSDDDSEDEDVSDSESESGDEKQAGGKSEKEKKPKLSWQDLATEWEKVSASIKENETEHKGLLEKVRTNEKQRNELERQRNRLYSQMGKTHTEEVNKAAKEKPKRKGNKDGGFNKETPVPPKLVKYLGLEEGVQMARPKVMSALNDKFKADGLKNGQTTTLDKETAKALGKEKGRVIEFTAFQSFLKEFYEEAFPSGNTVEL